MQPARNPSPTPDPAASSHPDVLSGSAVAGGQPLSGSPLRVGSQPLSGGHPGAGTAEGSGPASPSATSRQAEESTLKLEGARVTVMGLGLNGGGVATARFLASRGALVTVTDMKDEAALVDSVRSLDGLGIRFVLGRHDEADFSSADFVVKNPAVRPDNAFLKLARQVETDLSLFLRLCPARIAAVTGSKGKSTPATALAWRLGQAGFGVHLGGNITVSPLSFVDEIKADDIVVLELSSWQLGDLKGRGLLKPFVSIITRIVPDHLDRYGTMDRYVADKRLIYADQGPEDWTVLDLDDPWGRLFASETRAGILAYATDLDAAIAGAGLPAAPEASVHAGIAVPSDGSPCLARLQDGATVELVPQRLLVPGGHTRRNLAAAAMAAWACGAAPSRIAAAAASFAGVEHRLEPVRERRGVRWYNDSAATVPEAVAAAVESFTEPVVLITGGTDKVLDFSVARDAYRKAAAIVLLAGTGTDKFMHIRESAGIPWQGPFNDIVQAIASADSLARPDTVVVLSPGCTSFGMFKNEFDRGRSYKRAVMELPG